MSANADHRFEIVVGRVLRFGIVVSSCCLGVGLVAALAGGLTPFSRLLFAVGLVILLATPAARILVAAAMYARQREWLFVGLTLIVAAELLASVLAALSRP